MKKTRIIIAVLLIFIGIPLGYIQFKKNNVEQHIIEYLTTEENILKSNIISSEPFIANLRGEKNWMVSIKLKDDNKTYYYYKNKNNEVILESYTENGVEHGQ